MPSSLHAQALDWLGGHQAELVGWRRELHSHPEVGYSEHRTTELIVGVLTGFGLNPKRLSFGTGVICDVGAGPDYLALRADIDALPLPDTKTVSYASQNAGVCHACGHDVHTAILLAVAGCLARADELGGSVRLIFQPAEERLPGGAEAAVKEGALDGVNQIFALHCDPKLNVGQIGLRVGPITGATDRVSVRLSGPGGHTARPHLTADLIYSLGKVVTDTAAALSRRVDPRAGLSLVWGRISSGSAANAIPEAGEAEGTLRCLDPTAWEAAPAVFTEIVHSIAAQYGVKAEVEVVRGVPPCV
ncbi:MAG: amidohydrolase, partial [Jatrophihabitantaceae bacterium]